MNKVAWVHSEQFNPRDYFFQFAGILKNLFYSFWIRVPESRIFYLIIFDKETGLEIMSDLTQNWRPTLNALNEIWVKLILSIFSKDCIQPSLLFYTTQNLQAFFLISFNSAIFISESMT